MPEHLSIFRHVVSYDGDASQETLPQRAPVNWQHQVRSLPVARSSSERFSVEPFGTRTLFSGTRTTSADASTEWTLSLSPLGGGRYRFTHTAGTAPALRTLRSLPALVGQNVVVGGAADQTVTFTSVAGAFTGVVVGDNAFVPGLMTGDAAGPFSAPNQGLWVVLAVLAGDSQLVLARPPGETFQFTAETVTVGAAADFLVYSGLGVLVGDGVDVSGGFSWPVLGEYEVVAVTPGWFEVVSSVSLAPGAVAVPGASGVQFYSASRRYVELLLTQPAVVRVNGATGDHDRVAPWVPGDIKQAGTFIKTGLAHQVVVVNRSGYLLEGLLIWAEE